MGDKGEEIIVYLYAFIKKPLGAIISASLISGLCFWLGGVFSSASKWTNVEPLIQESNEYTVSKFSEIDARLLAQERRDSIDIENQKIIISLMGSMSSEIMGVKNSVGVVSDGLNEQKALTWNIGLRVDQIYLKIAK